LVTYTIGADNARRRRKMDDAARATFWIDHLGSEPVASLSTRLVERALSELKVRRIMKIRGKPVAQMIDPKPGTIVRYLTFLKAALNDAKRLGVLTENPAVRVRVPGVNNELVRYLTTQQESALLKALPHTYHDIVTVAIQTGLREGELLHLTWGDIDWLAGTITIVDPKSRETERVPMNSAVRSVLSARKEAVGDPVPDDRVFPHDGSRLRRTFSAAVK
jgi:integrase